MSMKKNSIETEVPLDETPKRKKHSHFLHVEISREQDLALNALLVRGARSALMRVLVDNIIQIMQDPEVGREFLGMMLSRQMTLRDIFMTPPSKET